MSAAAQWQAHKTDDGRVYYSNGIETTWTKPDALKTESERLLEQCGWKEFETPEGKK